MKKATITITVEQNLTEYVKEFYSTESVESICKKFNVSRQAISGIVRKLNKLGLIDTNQSYSKTIGILANKELAKNSAKVYQKRHYQKKKYLETLKAIEELNPKNFTNHNGAEKMECRKMVSEYIGKIAGRNPKILTLPSDKWLWEKEILKHKIEAKFIAVEYNIDTYNKMLTNYIASPELKNSVECMYNCPMSEVIAKSKTDEFSHMILDYCGIINSFENEINEVLIRDLVKVDGYISITLSKSSRHNNDSGKEISNILSAIPKNMFGDSLSDVEICTKLSIAKMVLNQDTKYKIVESKDYNDTKGQGMMLFVIQRIK